MAKKTKYLMLGHHLMITDYHRQQYGVGVSWTNKYSVQRLHVERPKRGKATYSVKCFHCGEVLEVEVSSAINLLLKQIVIAVVLGLVSIAVPLALIMFVPAFICIFLKPAEDYGVSLVGGKGSTDKHAILTQAVD